MALERLLIAYDGTECATAALDDLQRAGLPPALEALVLSISEEWVPELTGLGDAARMPEGAASEPANGHRSRGMQALEAAQSRASRVAAELAADHRGWNVRGEGRAQGAAWGILEAAREMRASLVVVGSHGRSTFGRVVLGSVSQKVLSEAPCSVRIARAPWTDRTAGVRIIVGVDGSADALAAIDEVARREWPAGSAVHLVSVVEPRRLRSGAVDENFDPHSSDDPLIVGMRTQQEHARAVIGERMLVTGRISIGEPIAELVDQAAGWGADAVFLGAKGHGLLERIVIGSVSAGVAARARCSVEVVRRAL